MAAAWLHNNGSARTRRAGWAAEAQERSFWSVLACCLFTLISFRLARALGFWFFGCLFCFMFPQTCQPHADIGLHKLTFCFYIIGLPFPSFPSLSQGTVAFTYLFIYFPFTLLCSVAAVIRKWVILGWTLMNCLFQRACLPGKFLKWGPS